MLAGCRLLKAVIKLAVVGGVLCLLLAMVGWKSLYAIVMLAGCGFLPKRSVNLNRPGRRKRHRAKSSPIVFVI
jgi:hypothetical protein